MPARPPSTTGPSAAPAKTTAPHDRVPAGGSAHAPPSWPEAIDDLRPTVLVLGGFLTAPPFYRPFRRRLLQRGAAAVIVANLWPWHWFGGIVGAMGPLAGNASKAAIRARTAASASPLSRGAPLLVIGHSAGGLLARILTSEPRFAGRTTGFAADIAAIVTLGTPHRVLRQPLVGARIDALATRFADRAVPGTFWAPTIGYVAVGARGIVGRADGNGRERVAHRLYGGLTGRGSTPSDGDGVVPADAALLDGALSILLDGVAHGQAAGRPWYGAEPVIDAWWPPALEAWRTALRARVDAASSPGDRSADEPVTSADVSLPEPPET
jgi:hypothetical protein